MAKGYSLIRPFSSILQLEGARVKMSATSFLFLAFKVGQTFFSFHDWKHLEQKAYLNSLSKEDEWEGGGGGSRRGGQGMGELFWA